VLLVATVVAGVALVLYFWLAGRIPYIPSPLLHSSEDGGQPSAAAMMIPTISAVFVDSLHQCPDPLPTSLAGTTYCWYLEWLTMYAAALQPLFRGTPRMAGNWSALVSTQMLLFADGQCEGNPLIYPLFAFERPSSAAGQDALGGRVAQVVYNVADEPSLRAALALPRGSANTTVLCQAGVYAFNSSLDFGAQDVDLAIVAVPGADVVWTGSVVFAPQWQQHTGSIYVAPIPPWVAVPFNEMYVGGGVQTRARWPNGNASVNVMGDSSWSSAFSWTTVSTPAAATEVDIANVRDTPYFSAYQMGYNGSASIYDPPQSYWAIANPSGGDAQPHMLPTSLTMGSSRASSWVNTSATVLHFIQCQGWASWQFGIQSVSGDVITLGAGGWQEARGCSGPCTSCVFMGMYVDHQFAELDAPGEYYVDAANRLLYYHPLPPGTPPAEVEVAQTPTIVSVSGSTRITLQGITFHHTSNTFMSPTHSAPGGGDWANTPLASIQIVGCRNCSVTNCLVTQVGGNAIHVGGNSSGTYIAFNEITATGANAVSVMGTMTGFNTSLETTQPSDTRIVSNLLADVGHYNKQSGMVLVALNYRTVVDGNVMAIGPRAAVNFQDGLGGGHVLSRNVILGTMRETNSGGPVNSWNRVPYSTPTAPSYLHDNVLLADNNDATIDQAALVLDDGALNWVAYHNVMLNSGFQMANYGANTSCLSSLIVSMVPWCWAYYTSPGGTGELRNNSCVLLNDLGNDGVQWVAEEEPVFLLGGSMLAHELAQTSNNSYYLFTAHQWAPPEYAPPYISISNGPMLTLSEFQAYAPTGWNEQNSSTQQLPIATYPYYRSMGLSLLGLPVDPCGIYGSSSAPPPPATSSTHRVAASLVDAYTDAFGLVWSPMVSLLPTQIQIGPAPTSGTSDPALYTAQQYTSGYLVYSFAVPAGNYSVTLLFYDFDNVGGRSINAAVNQVTLLTAFTPSASGSSPNNRAFDVSVASSSVVVFVWGQSIVLSGIQVQPASSVNRYAP
jgi:hypothetical protein